MKQAEAEQKIGYQMVAWPAELICPLKIREADSKRQGTEHLLREYRCLVGSARGFNKQLQENNGHLKPSQRD